VLQSFAPLKLRNDLGALRENFCIVEHKKHNQAQGRLVNQYFYRTYGGEEVDYVEEQNGQLFGYEFKFRKEHSKPARNFLANYKPAGLQTINKENWAEFLL
jgi:predicted AAA+ superfamily ATPase